ncbi:MAG TPA: large conductance mechanosensitive channel protein MscL [Candidatus Binatia bacterium]|nr:large conductance mechanosensitive channel protein MscL [Candidatus Binatia bacterium]
MLKEFREFAMRGSVLDLAVGVVIGGAFGKIVNSFVTDMLMPVVGLLLGRIDFSGLFVNFSGQEFATLADARKANAPVLAYGSFIQSIVDFVIIAFAIFLLVKQVNRFRKAEVPPPAAPPPRQEVLLEEIRDLIARRGLT